MTVPAPIEVTLDGKRILARRPGSTPHLDVVLALWHTGYVTWEHNKLDGGYYLGHYTDDYGSALSDYNGRL